MDRLNTFIGRFIRRQTGENGGGTIVLPLPIDIDLPVGTGRSTTPAASLTLPQGPVSTGRTSAITTGTSATSTPISTANTAPASTSTASTTTAVSTTIPLPASTTSPVVVVVQSTPVNETPTQTTLPASATEVSVVIENQTITRTSPAQTSSATPSQVAGASKNAFLENKVASGIVFGICGLVGLLLILLIIWLVMRKRIRISQLEKEIISFDPEDVGKYHRKPDIETSSTNSMEKASRSASSLDHYAGSGYATTMKVESGEYRNAVQYSDYYAPQVPVQRPGNAAFNPMGNSDMNHRTYAMPSRTFNR